MARVNKVDFYCGAFLSYLITNGVEPTLFDASDKSKIIKFSQKSVDYNVYLKYVSTSKSSTQGGKEYTRWDVMFTKNEMAILNNSFKEDNKTNLVVLVCANENFKDTYFAIIELKDALKCLGQDTINEQHRISVKRLKGSKYVNCYGTALADDKAIRIKNNYDSYFGFDTIT